MMTERITLSIQLERFRGSASSNTFVLNVDNSDDISLDLEDLQQLKLIIDDTLCHFGEKGVKRGGEA